MCACDCCNLQQIGGMTISPMRLLVDRQLAIHIVQEHKYRELYMRLDVISRSSKRAAAAPGIYLYSGCREREVEGMKREGEGKAAAVDGS